MALNLRADLLGRVTRSLPSRRWQAGHWLGKLLLPSGPFEARFQGGRVEIHPGEVASMSTFLTGIYEREVTLWALEQIRTGPPSLVVDVGANFGYYPLLFGLASQGRTETIAFEPDPTNFAWLSRNLSLNPGLRVRPVQMAVGSVDGGMVPFETAKDGHNVWARVSGLADNEHASGTVEVPSTTLDAYLDRAGIASVPITLIDVEGYERHVVEGMLTGIANRRYERVMIEFHPWAFPNPESTLADISATFLAAGYAGARFRHLTGKNIDRDPAAYDRRWDPSVLGPLAFDNLGSWEHFLFSADLSVKD